MTQILTNASVLTMAGSTAEAIAFDDSGILAVGSNADVRAAHSGDERDMGGAIVIPGFVDAHHHVSMSALWGGQVQLRPPLVKDIASFQTAVAQAAKTVPEGDWVVVTEWDETQLKERRPPTRAELDEACPDRPLFAMQYTCHRALVNSKALELAGIDRNTPDPSGGMIGRGRNGVPNGLLIERGMSRAEALSRASLIRSDTEGYMLRLKAHYESLVAAGITHVADTAVPMDLIPLYQEAVDRGHILIPTIVCPTSSTGYLEEPWEVLEGPRTGESFGPVTIGPVKLVFDGAPACAMCLGWWQTFGVSVRTALLAARTMSADPIRASLSIGPRFGAKIRSGIQIYQPDEANKVVGTLTSEGFSVATHAVGNEALETALRAYEAHGTLHKFGTARIEHASFADQLQIKRLADSGAAVGAQPAMIAMPAYDASPSIPGLPLFPLRQFLDAGITVGGSSDYPVTGFDPIVGIRAAVRRHTFTGRQIDPKERITVDEALAMFTREAAKTCGVLDRTGTLEVGKRADLVVLDGTLEDLDSLKVRETIVGGISGRE